MQRPAATLHASAVLTGNRALLIRGPAGSGKSSLALALLQAARAGELRFARLVADDRVELATCHGRLLLRAPQALAGLIELRGVGIRRVPWEGVAVAGRVIDLAAPDAERMPDQSAQSVEIQGVQLPRLAIGAGAQAAAVVLAALHSDAR